MIYNGSSVLHRIYVPYPLRIRRSGFIWGGRERKHNKSGFNRGNSSRKHQPLDELTLRGSSPYSPSYSLSTPYKFQHSFVLFGFPAAHFGFRILRTFWFPISVKAIWIFEYLNLEWITVIFFFFCCFSCSFSPFWLDQSVSPNQTLRLHLPLTLALLFLLFVSFSPFWLDQSVSPNQTSRLHLPLTHFQLSPFFLSFLFV
jgi:hypothetical protein